MLKIEMHEKISYFFAIFTVIVLLSLSGCQTSLKARPYTVLSSNQNIDVKDLSYNSIFSVKEPLSKNPDFNRRKVEKGWLGVSLIERDNKNDTKKQTKENQLLIQYVIENSPAEKFGLKKDDIILKLNEKTILPRLGASLSGEFVREIQRHSPGSSVTLTILRNKIIKNIKLGLGKMPKAPVPMADYKNLAKTIPARESLLEKTLKQQQMLSNYYEVADLIKKKSADIVSYRFDPNNHNLFRLGEVNYLLNHPLHTPILTRNLTGQLKKYFSPVDRNFSELLNFTAKKIDVDYSPKKLFKFPSELSLDTFLGSLLQLLLNASSIRQEAFSKLTKEEMDFLFLYSKIYLPSTTVKTDGETNKKITDEEEKELLRFLKLALKVDYEKLFYSSQIMLHVFDANTIERLKNLKISKEKLFVSDIDQIDIVSGDVILNKKTEIGRIIIGGYGQTIYWENSAVIIDLGGDDIYYNNAGSSTQNNPFSILVDLSGNDKYISTQPFTQGSGILGTGVLIDLSGDDIYTSRDLSQGIGILGSGFLIDLDGDDQYSGKSSVQGLGLFGMGFILEGGGNDLYLADRYAQGIGFTKGIGGIIEADGSDYMFAGGKYPDFRDPENATESFAQGFGYGLRPINTSVGSSGGIGLVYDQNGNDVYISDYFGQGASYWYAFGALVDEAGDDLYISGRYSQGAGIHVSIGTLIDEKGNDHYVSTFGVGQGCGHDFGTGVLIDNDGDDFYKGGVLVQGFGNETGMGILYDRKGNDKYVSDGGPGSGNFSSSHEAGSIGLHVDAEGVDSYSNGEKNSRVLNRKNWGLFWDM